MPWPRISTQFLGPSAIDLAMNVAFDESLAVLAGKRLAVRVELHHVRRRDQRRCARARHDEAPGAALAAGADMAVGVEHFVRREDTARGDEILNQPAACGEPGHQPLAGDPLMLLS